MTFENTKEVGAVTPIAENWQDPGSISACEDLSLRLCGFALNPSSTVRSLAYRFLQTNVAVTSPNAKAMPSDEYGCSRKTLSVATAPATA